MSNRATRRRTSGVFGSSDMKSNEPKIQDMMAPQGAPNTKTSNTPKVILNLPSSLMNIDAQKPSEPSSQSSSPKTRTRSGRNSPSKEKSTTSSPTTQIKEEQATKPEADKTGSETPLLKKIVLFSRPETDIISTTTSSSSLKETDTPTPSTNFKIKLTVKSPTTDGTSSSIPKSNLSHGINIIKITRVVSKPDLQSEVNVVDEKHKSAAVKKESKKQPSLAMPTPLRPIIRTPLLGATTSSTDATTSNDEKETTTTTRPKIAELPRTVTAVMLEHVKNSKMIEKEMKTFLADVLSKPDYFKSLTTHPLLPTPITTIHLSHYDQGPLKGDLFLEINLTLHKWRTLHTKSSHPPTIPAPRRASVIAKEDFFTYANGYLSTRRFSLHNPQLGWTDVENEESAEEILTVSDMYTKTQEEHDQILQLHETKRKAVAKNQTEIDMMEQQFVYMEMEMNAMKQEMEALSEHLVKRDMELKKAAEKPQQDTIEAKKQKLREENTHLINVIQHLNQSESSRLTNLDFWMTGIQSQNAKLRSQTRGLVDRFVSFYPPYRSQFEPSHAHEVHKKLVSVSEADESLTGADIASSKTTWSTAVEDDEADWYTQEDVKEILEEEKVWADSEFAKKEAQREIDFESIRIQQAQLEAEAAAAAAIAAANTEKNTNGAPKRTRPTRASINNGQPPHPQTHQQPPIPEEDEPRPPPPIPKRARESKAQALAAMNLETVDSPKPKPTAQEQQRLMELADKEKFLRELKYSLNEHRDDSQAIAYLISSINQHYVLDTNPIPLSSMETKSSTVPLKSPIASVPSLGNASTAPSTTGPTLTPPTATTTSKKRTSPAALNTATTPNPALTSPLSSTTTIQMPLDKLIPYFHNLIHAFVVSTAGPNPLPIHAQKKKPNTKKEKEPTPVFASLNPPLLKPIDPVFTTQQLIDTESSSSSITEVIPPFPEQVDFLHPVSKSSKPLDSVTKTLRKLVKTKTDQIGYLEKYATNSKVTDYWGLQLELRRKYCVLRCHEDYEEVFEGMEKRVLEELEARKEVLGDVRELKRKREMEVETEMGGVKKVRMEEVVQMPVVSNKRKMEEVNVKPEVEDQARKKARVGNGRKGSVMRA